MAKPHLLCLSVYPKYLISQQSPTKIRCNCGEASDEATLSVAVPLLFCLSVLARNLSSRQSAKRVFIRMLQCMRSINHTMCVGGRRPRLPQPKNRRDFFALVPHPTGRFSSLCRKSRGWCTSSCTIKTPRRSALRRGAAAEEIINVIGNVRDVGAAGTIDIARP